MSDGFESPKRRMLRALFDYRNACDDFLTDLRENDADAIHWARGVLGVAAALTASTLDRVNACDRKSDLVGFMAEICGREEPDDDDDNEDLPFDSDSGILPLPERAATMQLTRATHYLASAENSIEIKSDVSDMFTTRVFEIGGAQFLFHSCINLSIGCLRESYVLARPAGCPIVVQSNPYSHFVRGDVFAPFLFHQVSGVRDMAQWPIQLAVWGEQIRFRQLAPLSLDTVALGPLRALINLPHLTNDVGDHALRLLVACACQLPEFITPPAGVFATFEDLDSRSVVVDDFTTLGRATLVDSPALTKLTDWFHPFADMVDYLIALSPLRLPALVELMILDFLPGWRQASRFAKHKVIESVHRSIMALRDPTSSTAAAAAASSSSSKKRAFVATSEDD